MLSTARFSHQNVEWWWLATKAEKMTDLELIIEEIRERLSKIPRGAGSIDPVSIANELGAVYAIPVQEICALVVREADAAGLSHF
jgi:hypothetical protein